MGSSSKGATTNVSNNSPPPEVMQEYENIINRANVVGSQPYQQYGGQMVAPMSGEQLSGIAGINNAQGIAQPYFNQAQDYLSLGAAPTTAYDINRFQNPYQQQVVQATLANLGQLNQEQQTGLEGNLMGSGGLFNDRLGVAQAQLAKQQATAEAPTIAGLNASGYSQALTAAQAEKNRQLGAASSEAGLGTANLADLLQGSQAQFGAGTAEQQLAQQYLNVPYQQFQAQQAYPYQQLSWLASIGTGVGSNMGGTSTSTTTPPKPWYQFWNRGGGIKRPGYDEGGGIGGYPYAGAPSYIPNISITHGSGPPKPAAGHQQKGQDPLGDIMKAGQSPMGKGMGKMFNPSTQGGIPDMMGMSGGGLDEATQAGAEAGLSPEELGFTAGGTDLLAGGAGAGAAGAGEAAGAGMAAEGGMDIGALFALLALKDGGGINLHRARRGGGIAGLHRLRRAEGGDTYGDDESFPDPRFVTPDDIPTSSTASSDAPTVAGLAPMAVAGTSGSPARAALPAGLSGLDPTGLAARPSGAPLWPGETAPPPKPSSSYPGMAGKVADQWREAGAKENAVKGVLYNVNAESGFRPELRHPDQPRFTGEAHYAHGMYQHGGNQWSGLDRYTQQNGQDWRDPKAQTAYEIENLKRTNPDVWRKMNEAPTWQEAAKVYARWLAPKKEYLDQREANIDRSVDPLHGYTGADTTGRGGDDRLPARATPTSGGVTLRSTSDGEGNGETRTTPGSGGIGRLFTADNALRFGLAMLANPTPYIGNAIGQAGLATLGASAEQERYGAKQFQEDRKFKLDAAYKQAQIDKIDKGFEMQGKKLDAANAAAAERGAHFQDLREHQQALEKQAAENAEAARKRDEARAAEGRYSMLPGTGAHPETGEQVSGVYKLDAKTGKTEFVPSIHLTGKPTGAGSPLPAEAWSKNGEDFINYLPPDERNFIKGVADYTIDPKTLSTRGGSREDAMKKALQYDPDFDQKNYNTRYQAIQRFTTGKQGDTVRSLNVAVEHLGTLKELTDALPSATNPAGNVQALNRINNYLQTQFGQPAVTNFNTGKQIIADEVLKAVLGTGAGSQEDRLQLQAQFNAANSPAQLAGAIRTAEKLMAGQVKGLRQQYEFATGARNFDKSLTPVTRKELQALESAPVGGGGTGTETPPVANARKAPDGKWYVPDPGRPGKYLQVQ